MKISDNGLAVVKAFEGCLKPVPGMAGHFRQYICPAGVPTIGWGHTNHHPPRFDAGTVWSQAKCDEVLRGDMGRFERHVEKHAPEVTIQHRFDALVSWSYNTGGPPSSAVWTYARRGDVAATRARLARWNKGGGRVLAGLVRRRESEADLFEGKIDEALRTAGAIRLLTRKPMPQRADRQSRQPRMSPRRFGARRAAPPPGRRSAPARRKSRNRTEVWAQARGSASLLGAAIVAIAIFRGRQEGPRLHRRLGMKRTECARR